MVGLGRGEIHYLQRICACSGIYDGPLDGKWSPAMDKAELTLDAKRQALRAEIGQFDPRSEGNIATLMPPAQTVAREFMNAASSFPLTVRIILGSRTYAEQDALAGSLSVRRPMKLPMHGETIRDARVQAASMLASG